MALNLLNVATVTASTSYVAPSTTTATTLLTNAASSGHIFKLNTILVSNVSVSATTATVSINSAAAGGGTAYRIAYQITIPANSTLVVSDKNSLIYVMENQSIVVTSGIANALEFIASYEDMA